ncbi:MAG TPA: ATP synthase F1 subunit gamma [Bacteroidales bacterium]|nr:ATP synthase F1 subunit gamma [Bacteroidales bacterium]
MPGLKEVRIRIASVKSTQQITNAMKMVAASKLRKAQSGILKLRPYAAKLREILDNLSGSIEDSGENAYTREREPVKILLVVIASNRGLCGAFNSNIIKAALQLMNTTYENSFRNGNGSLLVIGRKASDFFRKRGYRIEEIRDDLLDGIAFDKVSPVAEKLMKAFTEKQFDRIQIIYNQFKNAAVQNLVTEQFLPIITQKPAGSKSTGATAVQADYIFEPDKETILKALIPKTLRIQLYKAVLDSFASEQGARMTAMQNATENANELLKDLRISYNKARQNAITKELLEIVAGAEALKG